MNNIPEGYKLVPVEPTNEMVTAIQDRIAVTSRGGKIGCKAALREAIAAAPILPQPIYDEAKERVLFEAWYGDLRLTSMDGKNRFMHDQDGTYWFIGTRKAWSGWLACAQSRAKTGEDE